MNIKIINDNKNQLFKRREISAVLGYEDKTLNRAEIRKETAKKLGVKEELIIIKKVTPEFGTPAAKLEANVYEDEKTLKEVEAEYLIQRHNPKEKKEKPSEEQPAETEKKEEAKEKKPAEPKPETKVSEPQAKPEEPEEKKEEPKKEKSQKE